MDSFDFDRDVQKEFNNSFSAIPKIEWKKWLRISSMEEFETLALKISGLEEISDIFERVKKEKIESRSFAVNLDSYIKDYQGSDLLVMVHTSGTTNSSLAGIKWFHMKPSIVNKLWAPGMQAIFESSNLSPDHSVVIFVPSRLRFDGIQKLENKKYISLYSSEFSQRIMLSIIKPLSYLLYEYKDSKNLEIISKIISLKNLSVISAPAATILGWADIEKLRIGLKKSLDFLTKSNNPQLEEFLTLINKEGFNDASIKIQKMLSDKVSNATVIFSISSLNLNQWELIRNFMKWEKGAELFTNLYVGSEIGPFASSLGDFDIARSNKMYVFPLTFPVLEYRKNLNLITRSTNKIGKLLVSRFNDFNPLINIDTGDIITLDNQQNTPLIGGDIFRASFHLKYPIKISNSIRIPKNSHIYAGDFFALRNFEIFAPRYLLDCLINNCQFKTDSLLMVGAEDSEDPWKLILPFNKESLCKNNNDVLKTISNCPKEKEIERAIQNNNLRLKLINEQPIDFMATRTEILSKVQKGDTPKGILKRWPLYLVVPTSSSAEIDF